MYVHVLTANLVLKKKTIFSNDKAESVITSFHDSE